MSFRSWVPEEEILKSVVDILRESFVPNTEIQKLVQQKIAFMQNHPDFVNYLIYVLIKSETYENDVRAISGIILKNSLNKTYVNWPRDTVDNLKSELLLLLKDASKDVRGSVTSLINTVVIKVGITNWPEIIPYLTEIMDSSNEQLCETALIALFKICEDYLLGMEPNQFFDKSIKELLLKFTNLVGSERLPVRKNSIKVLNMALQDHYDAIKNDFDSSSYLEKLFLLVDDPCFETQKLVCQGLVAFIDNRDAVILPHMYLVIELMLRKTQHDDDALALQACEFWLACTGLPACRSILLPYMDQLLPILLSNMRYSDFELDNLKDLLGCDEHLQDKSEDVKPFSTHNSEDVTNYDLVDAVDEPYVGWTLRKCSAASLDAISVQFQEDMLPGFIGILNEALNSNDVLRKESGILALGAIAEGCMDGLKPYLDELVRYLMTCLNDHQSIIRVITCWTISRYMRWIVNYGNEEMYFKPVMMNLMKHFLDGNKRVQRAALSAFCVFQEEAGLKLVPYIELILQAFLEAFNQYKFRSFYLLYDAIGVLSQAVGNNLGNYTEVLMPYLLQKFNSIDDYCDDQFLGLTECLSNVATAIDVRFLPYAEGVYGRCLGIINDTVQAVIHNAENPDELEPPDKEPMCAAHDMILAMAIALKSYFVKYATNSNLIQQLYYTMQDEKPQIRQPALALYGELIRLCFEFLSTHTHEYIPIIIENLDKRYEGVCNNAAWVIGRLCMALGKNIEPYTGQIMEHFIEIMQNSNGSKTVYQTVAISLCTLGYICPNEVAPHLLTILRPCCQAMRNVRDCEEKELGFRGLCELIYRNPQALPNDFIYFCDAVASWNNIVIDLKEIVKNILLSFRQQCGESNWTQLYEQFPPLLKLRLNNLYGV